VGANRNSAHSCRGRQRHRDPEREIPCKGLPFGEWSFYAGEAGFQSYRAAINICDAREQIIAVKLAPWPEQGGSLGMGQPSSG